MYFFIVASLIVNITVLHTENKYPVHLEGAQFVEETESPLYRWDGFPPLHWTTSAFQSCEFLPGLHFTAVGHRCICVFLTLIPTPTCLSALYIPMPCEVQSLLLSSPSALGV